MSIKASSPPVDPETKARQEAAERRAEAGRIEATQDNLSADTRAVLRNFGRLAGGSGGRGGFNAGPLLPIPGVSRLTPLSGGVRAGGSLSRTPRSLV